MSELMNKVSKDGIRGQLNLLYAMMKFMATLMDLASENEMARASLTDTADCLFQQTAVLLRDISTYAEMIHQTEKETA